YVGADVYCRHYCSGNGNPPARPISVSVSGNAGIHHGRPTPAWPLHGLSPLGTVSLSRSHHLSFLLTFLYEVEKCPGCFPPGGNSATPAFWESTGGMPPIFLIPIRAHFIRWWTISCECETCVCKFVCRRPKSTPLLTRTGACGDWMNSCKAAKSLS